MTIGAQKWESVVTLNRFQEVQYNAGIITYWCLVLTIDFGKPNFPFQLLSQKCPKSNLNTTFINKDTTATPWLLQNGYSLSISRQNQFKSMAAVWQLSFWAAYVRLRNEM